ncbi:hypothetical protein PsYK624_148250 [Phanerochaete sordida]|uniref:Uncharacterized protein n=1 Tax=Phanerochaete sordida TaxID=48140 RepID=A0A9P3LKJ4_9APHY|nr:hypothetical protein PsYK624_148250 [Phanerochaete sordida]
MTRGGPLRCISRSLARGCPTVRRSPTRTGADGHARPGLPPLARRCADGHNSVGARRCSRQGEDYTTGPNGLARALERMPCLEHLAVELGAELLDHLDTVPPPKLRCLRV